MSTVKKKQTKWPRERILEEIRRLDAQTVLNGTKVTIRLYAEPEPLGYFTFIDPIRMTFGFSSTRFEEPGFTDTEALDIIRHEYAHYMEYQLYGFSSDHGPDWQACCRKIGARPEKLYTESFKQDARKKERERNSAHPGGRLPGRQADPSSHIRPGHCGKNRQDGKYHNSYHPLW